GQRTDADEVAALVGAVNTRLLLAERAGKLLASVLLQAAAQHDPRRAAYLGMFAVEPALQAGGIGRALLAELERRVVTEQSAARVRMTVIAQRTELIAWYERRGYALTGEAEPFPYGVARFGLPRRPDLVFVVLEKALY
ncbi:MAG TPA: GNAT family N-acetyltransferase, partial [Polyangiales bacterium]